MKQSSHPSAESFAAQELTAGIKVEIHALQLGHASVPHLERNSHRHGLDDTRL
jgi:hypothetical protein